MGPAPLPPHERSWRHPSELAPTSVVVDDRPARGRSIVFATGVLAVALVAAIVISIEPTPPPPDAVSATTIAVIAATAQEREPTPASDPAPVLLRQHSVTVDRSLVLTGAPAAVSAKHVTDPADLTLAPHSPDDHHTVVLLTRTHTFLVDWGDLDRIDAPDGAVVVSSDGHLLATFVSGELRVLVD